jgi:hypothetical protein
MTCHIQKHDLLWRTLGFMQAVNISPEMLRVFPAWLFAGKATDSSGQSGKNPAHGFLVKGR